MTWKSGDRVVIECEGKTSVGVIVLASPNSVSLMLAFDGELSRHLDMMPVLQHDDGIYRALFGGAEVTLSKPQ